jgi:23S rRNA G2069 N7-methylase RlmK/C1962 C5-methylase RlmI
LILSSAAEAKGVARLTLQRGKAALFWAGNPVVYGGAVADVAAARGHQPPSTGDACVVADHTGAPLGWGTFNGTSMYRCRLLATAGELEARPELALLDVTAAIRLRVAAAAALRRRLALPTAGVTDTYRLINSEGDRLSGLVADVFGEYIVVVSTAAWLEQRRGDVAQALLTACPGAKALLWRPSPDLLRLEGIETPQLAQLFMAGGGTPTELAPAWAAAADDDAASAPAGEGDAGQQGALPDRVTVVENGVRYSVALKTGQKTGFYCDQRDSRARTRAAAAGARVLDLCCYSGGFAISAALGGAAHVTGVDSSASALALARENAALNGVTACEFVEADVLDFMRDRLKAGEAQSYDIVVLDPPKLAPNRDALARASGRYRRLNEAAARLVKPGGLLLSCSCSGAMTQSGAFPGLVADAAAAAGRGAALLSVSGAAQCHVRAAGHAEGQYLTAVLLGLS